MAATSKLSGLPKVLYPVRTQGAILPGDSTVSMSEVTIPALKFGEVLVQTKASTICGSDIRCIYRQHLGKVAEGYQSGIIAGHEPAGVIVDVHAGGTKSFNRGDRVLVYHVSGWNLHPEDLVTHRFSLAEADEAYRVMAEGHCGKVAVVFD